MQKCRSLYSLMILLGAVSIISMEPVLSETTLFNSSLGLTYSPFAIDNNVSNFTELNNSTIINNESIRAARLKLPLSFIENRGQVSDEIKFMVKTSGQTVFFASSEVVFALSSGNNSSVVHMSFEGSRPGHIGSDQQLPGTANFFIGNESSKWIMDIPTYGVVRYKDLYPGVDLVFKGTEGNLKHELILSPGADLAEIVFSYSGQDNVSLANDGSLLIRTATGNLQDSAPLCYQEINGGRVTIEAKYRMIDDHRISFNINSYNKGFPLVIDPAMKYSTYLGGSGSDICQKIAVDSHGNAYITGYTGSTNFPLQNPYHSTNAGGTDAFVTKLSSAGNTLVYSTYLGGNGLDFSMGIAVDDNGNAYVTGYTGSTDFPIKNPYQENRVGGPDVFVTKLNPAGNTLAYSTYLGGSSANYGFGIAVDDSGNAYVIGDTASTNFPIQNPYQSTLAGNYDIFVTKLNPAGNTPVYSTYLGGSVEDHGGSIAVDGSGNAYITGYTRSFDFPIQNAYQSSKAGYTDTFITKLNPGGDTLTYSTYLGGSGDHSSCCDSSYAYDIAIDSRDNAYITGYTNSNDFPTQNPYQNNKAGGYYDTGDAFITKINPDGDTLVYSTYLGGSNADNAYGIAVDGNDNAYVAGYTSSTNFPTQNPYQSTNAGGTDAFVTKLNPDGNKLINSTYLGGSGDDVGKSIAVDKNGNTYVTGDTTSIDFQTMNPMQESNAGEQDIFVEIMSSYDSPYDPIVFEGIDLVSAEGTDLMVNKDATLTITAKNKGLVSVPASDWNILLKFTDVYLMGVDDIATQVFKKDQPVQTKNLKMHFDQLDPGQERTFSYTFKLENRYADRNYLCFADKLEVWGNPDPLLIDYSDKNHYGLKDNLVIKVNVIGPAGACIYDAFKLFLTIYSDEILTKVVNKIDPTLTDPELTKKILKVSMDMNLLATDLMAGGVFDASKRDILSNLIWNSITLFPKLLPGIDPIVTAIDFTNTLFIEGPKDCSEFLNEMYFGVIKAASGVIKAANETGHHFIMLIFHDGTDVIVTNPSGESISIVGGTITNEIPNSSAFLIPDGEVVMVSGQDDLHLQIRGTNTSIMKITSVVPVGNNQSLYNQYEIPVIQGTILTTNYTITNGVEPIEVDIQDDGKVDSIKYPDVTEKSPQYGWNPYGGYIISNPYMITDSLGKNHNFVIGGDKALWDNKNGNWQCLGGYITSNPYAILDSQGRIHILVRGGDMALWDNVYDTFTGSSNWYALGGYITSDPKAALEPGGNSSLKIGVLGGDNATWLNSLDTQSMTGTWSCLGGYVISNAYPIFDSMGHLHTYVIGGDKALWDNIDGNWNYLGGYITSDPKPVIDPADWNVIRTFVQGGDSGLWVNSLNVSTFVSQWSGLGGIILPKENSNPIYDGSPEPASHIDETIHTFVIGSDHALLENVLNVNSGTTQWKGLGGYIASNPTSLQDNPIVPLIGVVGGDNALWINRPPE